MPEFSSFFDSTGTDEREYTADQFADYFRSFLTNGIFNGGEALRVSADGNDMRTFIKPGKSWINGYLYKVYDENFYITHDVADPSLDRIDRVVLRLDTSLEKRSISAVILKGTPASQPIVPPIVRENNIYDLALAQVIIEAGKSFIEAYQIADERLDSTVCGLVNSLIQADTTEIFNQYQLWYDQKTTDQKDIYEVWFNQFTDDKNIEYNGWYQPFKNNAETVWTDWFTTVKNQYDTLNINDMKDLVSKLNADVLSILFELALNNLIADDNLKTVYVDEADSFTVLQGDFDGSRVFI